jgi:hypothetical protein
MSEYPVYRESTLFAFGYALFARKSTRRASPRPDIVRESNDQATSFDDAFHGKYNSFHGNQAGRASDFWTGDAPGLLAEAGFQPNIRGICARSTEAAHLSRRMGVPAQSL